MFFFKKSFKTIRSIKSIMRQKTSSTFKNKVVLNYLRCITFSKLKSEKNNLTLFNHKVRYSFYAGFSYAFHDVFINNEYWFETNKIAPIILDCGSNIGLSIIYFKELYPNCKIISFEPDADAFECLKFNIESNAIADVELHNKALSDNESIIKLSYNENRPGSLTSSTEIVSASTYREVEAVKLSSYINDTIDFMKMDIEGAETSVFLDLKESGKLKFIRNIVLEYHHHLGGKKDCLSIVLAILEDYGFSYQLHSLDHYNDHTGGLQLIMIYASQKIT